MNVDRLILASVVLLTLCRWLLAGALESTALEAAFWMESGRLSPYFVDHGPLCAGLIRVGGGLFGESIWALRYFNPLLILAASGFLYLLARSVYHPVVARWSVVLFQLCPVVNLAGIFMIDVALALFLAVLGMWCVWCGLHRVRRWHGFWWGGGLALGLAITLSLPLSFLLLGLAVAISQTSRWRGQWGRPGIWVLLLVAVMVPAALLFACGHGELALRKSFGGLGFRPAHLVRGLFSWAFWTGPLLVLGLAWLGCRWRELRRDHGAGLLTAMGAVSLAGGLMWSGVAEPWTHVLWVGTLPCLIVLVGQWMQSDVELQIKSRWRRWALLTTGGLAALGVNSENVRMLGLLWPRVADTPRLEQGWEETAEAVAAALLSGGARQPGGLTVIAEDPAMAALLEFYLPDDALAYRPDPVYPRVHVVESAGWESIYDLWPNYSHALPGTDVSSPFRGVTALYISRHGSEKLPPNLVHAFKSTEPAAILEIKRDKRLLHRWHLFYFYDYQGLPL